MTRLTQADILTWAETYDGPPFHALLCDPPYHLTSITDRFGKDGAAPAQFGSDGAFQRASRGFMNATWDGLDENGQGIAFRPETWVALARHLHPGAFGMAFASSRGWHRMAVAIEDAGLIIHPVVMCWAFGSGFPKATRIDTQVDRAAGADRPVRGQRKQGGAKFGLTQQLIDNGGFNDPTRTSYADTAPATPLAAAWEGHRYGLQAMKPALEPVIVFQKPYAGRPVDCITRTGAGALNIEGGRVGTSKNVPASVGRRGRMIYGGDSLSNQNGDEDGFNPNIGRWPANLALVHHPLDTAAGCHPDCPARRLGEQSGDCPTGAAAKTRTATGSMFSPDSIHRGGKRAIADDPSTYTGGDTGTAARYFYNADWMLDRLEASDPVGYFAKASSAEREAGLDPMQIALMAELAGESFDATTVGDGRQTPIDNPYQRGETTRRNIHPTIKPLSLARWLATLLLPPPEYGPRRLLVPFAGTGSEMIGGLLAGFEQIEGIELDAAHVRIGRARLAYWQQRAGEFAAGQDITIKAAPAPPDGQMSIFDAYEEAA